ncbi:MAG: hypothetical protein WCI21_04145, partial [Alphaproteobacteria bacterium]
PGGTILAVAHRAIESLTRPDIAPPAGSRSGQVGSLVPPFMAQMGLNFKFSLHRNIIELIWLILGKIFLMEIQCRRRIPAFLLSFRRIT